MAEPLFILELEALGYYARAKSFCELRHGAFLQRPAAKPRTDVDPCDVWCSRPVDTLREYCNIIKIRMFWPLLFRIENPDFVVSCSATHMLVEHWKRLCDLEVMEDLFDLLKKVINVPYFIGGILKIGSRTEDGVFSVEDALEWVRCIGGVNILQKVKQIGTEIGDPNVWICLEIFFAEFKYYISKVALEDCDLIEEFKAVACENCKKSSEFMKLQGNKDFSLRNFSDAIISYTRAIEFCPVNHLLYGNRALCLILTRQYEKAMVDGKRAIILKPDWPKGHYHFCKALSLMGEHKLALKANERAQELCKNILDGFKDLIQQNEKLKKTLEEKSGIKQHNPQSWLPGNKQATVRDNSSSESHLTVSQEQKEIEKDSKRTQPDPKDHCHEKHAAMVTDIQRTESSGSALELAPSQSHQKKGKAKTKAGDSEKMRDHLESKVEFKALQEKIFSTVQQVDLTVFPEEVKSLVCEGSTALLDQRCHSAEQAFAQLLSILNPSELKQQNLRIINYVLIIYGHATALLGIGQPETLAKAEEQFKKIIEEYQEERFGCLAYYGIGRVYLRQNRFAAALSQFMKSQTMVNHRIVPGVLTWPASSQVIEETRTENLQGILRKCIEECRFPPEPDAVCRYQQCHGHSKIHIYFTDPDFKGFIRMTCCQQCRVEFHISCWKKLKMTCYSDKNDKDFLQESCFTPDCSSLISKIVIFSSSGLIKCELEQKITRTKEPPRPIIKQKCSSLRKLKMKLEKKMQRKRAREEARRAATKKTEENQSGSEASEYRDHRGSIQGFCAGDRVLEHLGRNAERIKAAVQDASQLLQGLLSWAVISEEDYMSYSKTSSTSPEVLEQLISYLTREKNRVKTRSFIHVLSELQEVDPKLHKWLKHLNNLGLTATKYFILQYGQLLRQLDLSILIPCWNEKYGSKFDYVTTSSEDIDYFLKPPLEKNRCFLWLLEDNREKFPFLDQALDEFFYKMDDPTIILKKQGNENIPLKHKSTRYFVDDELFKDEDEVVIKVAEARSCAESAPWERGNKANKTHGIKVKNKNRKKNSKDSKSILVLSSGVSTAPREEDKIFVEENTLDFSNSHEPFVIPEHLREQVEKFEALFASSNNNSSQRHLENSDPASESLHDNFFQIGHNEEEDHKACDVQEDSAKNKQQLDPAAKEFKPRSYPDNPFIAAAPDLTVALLSAPQYLSWSYPASCAAACPLYSQSVGTIENKASFSDTSLGCFASPNTGIFWPLTSWGYPYRRVLPVPPQMALLPSEAEQQSYTPAAHQDDDKSSISDRKCVLSSFVPAEIQSYEAPKCQLENLANTVYEDSVATANNAYEAERATEVKNESRALPVMKSIPHTRMMAVQVNGEVADRETNTLPFHPFEMQQGDILRMEKEHQVLKEQFKEAQEKHEQLQSRSLEETSALKELVKKSVEETEVSKNELNWFHQDLEVQVKKWQQEKKENQENLKALKNTAKKHTDTNDRYLKTIDEKEKQYNIYLNTYLETSNKFANEKVKLEELIKKSEDDCQECVKRAVKAELSVLRNWQQAEVSKLHGIAADAETSLKVLKSFSSSSASAAPTLKPQIDSWEIFISNVKEQLKKVEAEYEEKIQMVENGVRNCLTKVQTVDLPPPPSILTKQGGPPVSDPAIVMYSFASARFPLFPAFSSAEDQGPTHTSFKTEARVKPGFAGSVACSTSGRSVKMGSRPLEGSYSHKGSAACPSGIAGSNAHNVQAKQHPQSDSAGQAKPSGLQNAFENILQLQSIFPEYSSSDFINFIKDVQRRSGNSLSGLSSSEILSRVTEHILDQQSKAPTSAGRPGAPSGEVPAAQTVAGPPKARKPSHKNLSQPQLQPWGGAGTTPKAKWNKPAYTVSSDDPCTICHDELRGDSCALQCGHCFHKECIRRWLKQHSSTCPICRTHAVLPEDFPELPPRNRH